MLELAGCETVLYIIHPQVDYNLLIMLEEISNRVETFLSNRVEAQVHHTQRRETLDFIEELNGSFV